MKKVKTIPIKHGHPEPGITKKEFIGILSKAVEKKGSN